MQKSLRFIISAAVAALSLAPALARELPEASYAPIAGPAPSLAAREAFCLASPDECALDLNQSGTIRLTPRIWRLIERINRQVNRNVLGVKDIDHHGVADVWGYPEDGKGDCEDYQLEKRRLLEAAGLPRRAMRIAVVLDPLGEGHAVLMIRTDRGDFILDNQTKAVLAWDKTAHTLIKREDQNGSGWVLFGTPAVTIATATP